MYMYVTLANFYHLGLQRGVSICENCLFVLFVVGPGAWLSASTIPLLKPTWLGPLTLMRLGGGGFVCLRFPSVGDSNS